MCAATNNSLLKPLTLGTDLKHSLLRVTFVRFFYRVFLDHELFLRGVHMIRINNPALR